MTKSAKKKTVKKVIEVSERIMDYRWVTVADEDGKAKQERRPKYHAQVKDFGGIWGAGDSPAEAIGAMMMSHPEEFGLKLDFLGRQGR